MRDFERKDRAVIQHAWANPSDCILGPCLADIARAFTTAGLRWPVLNPEYGKPDAYADLVDRAICEVMEQTRWRVTLEGVPTGTEGSWNDCWLTLSWVSGCTSADWQLRHGKYAIEAIVDEATNHDSTAAYTLSGVLHGDRASCARAL